MSYIPSGTSPEKIWTYNQRSIKIVKKTVDDTNTYSATTSAYTLLVTEYLDFGVPNANVLIRKLTTKYTLTPESTTTVEAYIEIGAKTYSHHSANTTTTFSDTYEPYPDIVKTDSNGNIEVKIYGKNDNGSFSVSVSNIYIEIIGEVIM